MAEVAEIHVAYNRQMLGRLIVLYGVLCILCLPMFVLMSGGSLYFLFTENWPVRLFGLLGLFVATLVAIAIRHFFDYVARLWQGLRQGEPAIIINGIGIVDNISAYPAGQLAWSEIERMYPWTSEARLLSNRFFKTPILAKRRFIVIKMKDTTYLKRLPWFQSFWIRVDNYYGRGQWILVPESYLEITADELMQRLNRFYTTQVRGY